MDLGVNCEWAHLAKWVMMLLQKEGLREEENLDTF
jgi:hypothetical protein